MGKPPKILQYFLKKVIPETDREFLLGDYEYIFNDIKENEGTLKAHAWYWCHFFKTVPEFISNFMYWGFSMFINYLKIAFRNFKKQKMYTGINLAGLAIGMAAVIFIFLWVNDELSYDRFHKNSNRIYRITQKFEYGGKVLHQTQTPGILASTLLNACPEVEHVTRVRRYGTGTLIKTGNKVLNETRLGMADNSFFKVFSFELLTGNPETALASPFTAIISESAAEKYFGIENPIGKILNIYENDYQISGIYEDMPPNSHFHLDILFSVATFPRYEEPNWGSNAFKTYALLRKGADPAVLQAKLNEIIRNNMFNTVEDYDRNLANGDMTTMPIQKLTDIHLNSHLLWEFEANGNSNYVTYLSYIAIFILLIALINYVNLSTARSAGRAKEVGIRKVVGSNRSSLIRQFIAESVLTSFLSLLLTIVLVVLLMSTFKQLVGKPWLNLNIFGAYGLIFSGIGFVLLAGVLAGIYPSMVLSSFKPVSVLSGKLRFGTKKSGLRNGLVVFQFAMSIMLLVGALVVHQQMKFSQTKSLGFDKEHVLVVKTYGEAESKYNVLREELLKNPSILNAAVSTSVPGKRFTNIGIKLEGQNNNSGTNMYAVDYDFLDVMKMEMVQGRFFSREIPSDAEGIIINESKAKEVGITDIENKRFFVWTGREKGVLPFKVIGMVKDFHYESFHEKVKPMAMILTPGIADWGENYLSVRTGSGNIREIINYIDNTWSKIIPGVPFEYSFMDNIYNDLHKNEERTGNIFTIFTCFALLVSCMGLIGLTSFVVEQKRKEIGIRKVLGASVHGLAIKLSREFTRWVMVANVIAWPLAYIWMETWLENFAYRIELDVWVFIFAGMLALLISALTVSMQSIRAAKNNPVDSLKYE